MNIPREELKNIVDQYKRLPFRNGTPATVDIEVTTTVKAFIESSNADNDSVIAMSEGINFDEELLHEVVQQNREYRTRIDRVKAGMEALIKDIVSSCKAHRVRENEVWEYLRKLPR